MFRKSFFLLLWPALLAVGLRYYSVAGTEIWVKDVHDSIHNWLFGSISTLITVMIAVQPNAFRWQSLFWWVTPTLICGQLAQLTERCVHIFFLYPSPQTISAVATGGRVLLLALLAWILFAPVSTPADGTQHRLYKASHAFHLVLGLSLAIFIFRTVLPDPRGNDRDSESQIILFDHQFQKVGVLLQLLLFSRCFLPMTLVELLPAVRRVTPTPQTVHPN